LTTEGKLISPEQNRHAEAISIRIDVRCEKLSLHLEEYIKVHTQKKNKEVEGTSGVGTGID
jgi:hypothetical protein